MLSLSHDLLQTIVEWVSFEALLYLFPTAARRQIELYPQQYTYTWACNITDNRLRIRALLMLLDLERLPENAYLLDHCSQKGNILLLQRIFRLLQKNALHLPSTFYSHRAVDWASQYGWIHVLEWWLENCRQLRLPFRYSQYALDGASKNGQLNSLDWWKRQFLQHNHVVLKYTKDAMDYAHCPQVLDWWLKMNLEHDVLLKYSTRSIDTCKDTRILDWWLAAFNTYGIRMKYKSTSINTASANGDRAILRWWFDRTPITLVPLKYSDHAMDHASANGHVDILEWWLNQWEEHRHHLLYTSAAIDIASEHGHLHVLEWWFSKHQEGRVLFKRTVQAVNQASRNGHLHVLNWWIQLYRRHKIPFLYDSWAIEWALDNPAVMAWWVETGSRNVLSIEAINWTRYRRLPSKR